MLASIGRFAGFLAALMFAIMSVAGSAQAQTITGTPTANPTSYSRIGDTTTFTVSFNTGGVAWNGVSSISVGAGYNGTVSNINCNLAANNATNQNVTCTFLYTFGSDDTGSDFIAIPAITLGNTTFSYSSFLIITYNRPPSPTSFTAAASPNPWSLAGQTVGLTATSSGSTGPVDGRVLFYTQDGLGNITSSVKALMTNGSATANLAIPASTTSITAYYPGGTYGFALATINRTVAVLTLTPTASGNTQVGVGYSQTNAATNGSTPYSYAVTQGALPAGTTLNTSNGTVSGTPTTAGNFSYRITVTDNAAATASATTSGTIAQGANAITFPALANTAFTAMPPVPAATASSNLTVTYSTTTGAVCSVTSGGAISFLSTGTCTITASQAGNANYVAAADVSQSFTVTPVSTTTTLTYGNAGQSTYGESVTLTATVTAGTGIPSGTVEFYDGNTFLASGSLNASGIVSVSVTTISGGNRTLKAKYLGGVGFNISEGQTSYTVNAASTSTAVSVSPSGSSPVGQFITLTATVSSPGGAPYGTVQFIENNLIIGGSILDGTGKASYQTPVLSVGTRTYSAFYMGTSDFSQSTAPDLSYSVTTAPTVTTLTASPSGSSTFGQSVTLTVNVSSQSGSPGGQVTITDSISGELGTVTLDNAGQGTLTTSALTAAARTLTASYAGTAYYSASDSAPLGYTVNPAAQTITFPALTNTAFTATPPVPAATASSNLTVTYTSTTAPVCTVTGGGAISFVSAGTCTITASQAGNSNFNAATDVSQSFTVTPGANTITFPALANTAFTATPPVPAATASSNLTVIYTSTTAPVCTVTSGGAISFVSAGTCTITASQAGNANFAAATDVSQSFTVTPGANTITFPALANTAFTATPPVPAATASSNLTVIYTSTTAPVCTVTSGGAISFVSAGTCTITASQGGNANFAAATDVSQSFTVTPGANTITFPALPNTAFTATPPVPAASASSNLTVSYASTTALVCTVTGGGAITFVFAGTCTITASQGGNANFAAATDVSQSFTVTPGANTITFPALPNTAFTATPPVPAASASSNLTVTYTSTTAPVCTVTGGGTISFVSAGTCTITASQAGNSNFNAATDVSQSFTVTPGANTITFPALPNTAFSATPPVPAATASSNLTVSYSTTTGAVCSVTSGGAISFVSAGTCTIMASQAGNANFAAAADVSQSFTVTPGVNTIIFPALANTAFTATPPVPAASASSNLTVSYASTTAPVCTVTGGGAISFVSAGTCTITASQAGNANFAAATDVSRSFNVTPGANTITFPALPNTAFTSPAPVPAATASSNLAVSYASTTAPVCTVRGGGAISFVSAGTCTITASQAGNANYVAAADVSQSFTVTLGVNTITFPALPNTAFTATPPVPAASASSNLTVSYASTTAPVCTVTGGGAISFVAAGTCTITASQAGNANFAAATDVSRSFNVTPGANTITFPALANTAFTATPPVPAASASSNLTVSYASTTTPVCTVTGGGAISFVSAGTCTITASQAGNANFNAATDVSQSFTVTPGVNTITFPALANTAFTAPPPVPAASASSKLAVAYASTTPSVCTATEAGVIDFVSAGTCTITASQAGNAHFAAATPVTRSFNVTPGTNVITFPALANTAFTSAPPVPTATASSKLAVSYASTTMPVCTVTQTGVIAFVKGGICSIRASQLGNADFAAATPVIRSFRVTPGVNTITFPALPNTAFNKAPPVPAATASSKLAVTYASATPLVCTATGTGAITFVKPGTCSIRASQTGDASFAAASPVTRSFTVLRVVTVAVTSSSPVSAYGTSLTFTATVKPTSGVPSSGEVSFRDGATLLGTGVLSGGKATLTTAVLGVGLHSISVTYGGSTIDAPAASVRIKQTVTKATPSISLAVTPNPVNLGRVTTIQATVLAAQQNAVPPSGRVVFRDGATVIGTTPLSAGKATLKTSSLALGGHVITARYEGDARYRVATSNAVLLTVERSCEDMFAQARALEGTTGAASGSTERATGEPGERQFPGDKGAINSVWCKWTATAPGLAFFDTTGSLFDTTLAVYTGTSLADLKAVAANDNSFLGGKQSLVAFPTVAGKTYYLRIDGAGNARGDYILKWFHWYRSPKIGAAVVPGARSAPLGSTMTVSATIRNDGSTTATRCAVALPAGFPASLSFQAATPAGLPALPRNVPVSIAPGTTRHFVLGIAPTKAMNAADIPLVFSCENTGPAVAVTGLSRLIMSAATAPTSDVLTAASTPSGNGTVTIPPTNSAVFTVRSQNLGAAETLFVSADTGNRNLPLSVTLCRNDPVTGMCASGSKPAASVRVVSAANQTDTFTVFVKAKGAIPFNPVLNRVQLRWNTSDGVTRGIVSVAISTQGVAQ